PIGAQVAMGGKLLGETPLNRDGLEPKSGELVISKAGYETIREKVKLELGKTTEIKRDLKELAKMGTVMIEITASATSSATFAEAFYKGKDLGRTKDLHGPTAFKLPLGSQQIKLVHPTDKKKAKTITVNVTETPQTIKASFD
ncbi:MAG TPA: PEGA domain-containing protein, partial [Kofleriaceae bacterium]|nr:PEGA domain-containing protein [Kofleriaceae bacterium]